MAEEVGDEHEVGAAADEGGGEGVATGVRGGRLVQSGGLGDGVEHVAGAAHAQAGAAAVEQQGGAAGGAGPAGPFGQPEPLLDLDRLKIHGCRTLSMLDTRSLYVPARYRVLWNPSSCLTPTLPCGLVWFSVMARRYW